MADVKSCWSRDCWGEMGREIQEEYSVAEVGGTQKGLLSENEDAWVCESLGDGEESDVLLPKMFLRLQVLVP